MSTVSRIQVGIVLAYHFMVLVGVWNGRPIRWRQHIAISLFLFAIAGHHLAALPVILSMAFFSWGGVPFTVRQAFWLIDHEWLCQIFILLVAWRLWTGQWRSPWLLPRPLRWLSRSREVAR